MRGPVKIRRRPLSPAGVIKRGEVAMPARGHGRLERVGVGCLGNQT